MEKGGRGTKEMRKRELGRETGVEGEREGGGEERGERESVVVGGGAREMSKRELGREGVEREGGGREERVGGQ